MGAIWLHDVPAWFTKAGIQFREYPGWRTRSRSSGGFDEVWGGVAHHTGSPPAATWQDDCAYMWLNATTKPIGNFHLDRAGVWTLGAAGASNTNGRGLADWHTSRGVIPIDPSAMGNRMAFAVEAASNGVGELWSKVQADSYFAGLAVLCDELGLDPLRDITTHRGWAGPRKSDPFGPVEGYATLGSQSWPVPALQSIVAAALPGDDVVTDEDIARIAAATAAAVELDDADIARIADAVLAKIPVDEIADAAALKVWRTQINDGTTGVKQNTASMLGWTRRDAALILDVVDDDATSGAA